LLGFGSALLGSCCSACVARFHLASLGLGHLALLSSASLGSRCSARSDCVASLSLASWLAARITRSRHSACVGLRQLWLALLGSRHEPSVTWLRLTCVAGWLASSLACFAGVAGSLAGARAQLSSLGTLLGLESLRSASRRWLALLACCSHRWLPSLGLRQRQLTSHRLACVALLTFFQ